MTGRAIPPGAITFHTAFDVALAEMRAGRLSDAQVTTIGKALLREGQQEPWHLFPTYTKCPEGLAYTKEPMDSAELGAVKTDVQAFINGYCAAQNKRSQWQQAVDQLQHFLQEHNASGLR